MASIKQTAKDFIPKQTKNIADLDIVSVEQEIFSDGQGMDNDGKQFEYSYIVINNEEYRVPNSVIAQLKDLLSENDKLTKFKVKKSGESLKTRYTVIPIM